MGIIKNLQGALQELDKMKPAHNLFGGIDKIQFSINAALKELVSSYEHDEELKELFEDDLRETGGFVKQVSETDFVSYTPTEKQYQQAFTEFKNSLIEY